MLNKKNIFLLVFWVTGCASSSPQPKTSAAAPTSVQSGGTHLSTAAPTPEKTMPWFEDQYDLAIQKARELNRPLFVDTWAKWCHTCLSMKNFVLNDGRLSSYADKFVWLMLDLDKDENASALERLTISAVPTFFIIRPTDHLVLSRFLGAATVEQLSYFFDQGILAFHGEKEATSVEQPQEPDFLLRQADQAVHSKEFGKAAALYRDALRVGGPAWPRRGDSLVSLAFALQSASEWSQCVVLGEEDLSSLGNTASAIDLASLVVECADNLGANEADRKKSLLQRLVVYLGTITEDERAPLSVDDRSGALILFRDLHEKLKDSEAAKQVAQNQLALLDSAARAAATPRAAATFNAHRAEVYVYLGRGATLIPELEASMRALPAEYDPPYRLAWVALKIGDLDRALSAAKQACKLAYGPRKGRALALLADVYKAKKDKAAELATRRAVVDHLAALPAGRSRDSQLEQARQILSDLQDNK